jgi:membrane-associated protein
VITWLINHLLVFSGWTALAIVFALPALESSIFLGFIIPGETAVIVGGFLAYEHKVSFAAILAAACLGAIIGDSIGFEVGRKWGDALLNRLPHRLVKPAHIAQGKESIKRLGGRAVFVGRWVAALRALVPGLCGASRMHYRTFLPWNAIGGITWATTFTLVGYLAGSAWQRVEHYTNVVSYGLLGLVVVVIVGVIWWRRRHQADEDEETRQESPGEDGGEDDEDTADRPGPDADPGTGADPKAGPDPRTKADAEAEASARRARRAVRGPR